MKILLIYPPVKYIYGSAKPSFNIPLGLLYIASVVRQGGHEVSVFDGSVKDFYEINERLNDFKPDIIGINVMECYLKFISILALINNLHYS